MAGNLDFQLNLLANTTGLQKGMDSARFALNALAGAMAALGVGLGIRELADAADAYANLSARINIATSDNGNFEQAMSGVHQVALMTNSSLDATAGLFTKVNDVGKQMGMTQQQSLDLVKTINMAIQTGGGSAQASEAAIVQLTQALQSGVLRGDEFNSIMEQAPGISKALAQSLGVTTGELRKMAENGELSAEKVIKALQGQSAAIEADYAKFPTTIGNALQRIQTQWQILIGTMDQSNGASAAVAQWLVTISDNMGMVETLLNDIGEGFIWAGDQLKKIDPATIEALKAALSSVYDVVKSVGSALATSFEAAGDLINTALSQVFSFSSGVDAASDKTNGFTKVLQVINVALGYLADGFNAIGIGINLFVGALYSAGSAWEGLKSNFTWGAVRDEAIANMTAMQNKAEEYYQKAEDGALNFESQGKKAWEEISKTQEQKNAESLQSSKDTLDKLAKQEQEHTASYKAIADERLKLEQQLYEARKTGSQTSIDMALKGLADLDVKEKAYQAESQKITDAKVEAAQVVASAMVESADAAGFAELKTLNAKLAAQGLMAEFDSTGKVVVKAMQDAAIATDGQVNATDQARKAATALGLDLDVSLNRVSAKFKETETSVDNFSAGLEDLGVTGEDAGNLTYEAWLKWLQTAKSQAEIDYAKAKLEEFGNQGQISTSQVEQGLIAIKIQAQGLPDDIDPVTEAFKRLGIQTREQLKLAAQQALMDYITIRDSGKATAEGIEKAYQKAAQSAAASGDAGRIAAVNAMNAGRNLEVQIDDTGKAVVKTMDDWEKANHRVRDSARGIGDGYRHAGQIAREEAKSSTEAWADAVNKAKGDFNKEMKRQGEALSKGIYDYNSYSKSDVLSELKSKGYDDKDAQKLAGEIWSKAMAADRSAKEQGLGKESSVAMKALINAEFDRAAANGITTQHGTNKINDLLRNINVASTGSYVPSTPSSPSTSNLQGGGKTVNYQIQFDGKTLDFSGTAEQESLMNQLVNQLKVQAKST